MLRGLRFTSRSMVVWRVGGVPYWPCGGGRWWGCRGWSCCELNCWWWREGWWSPLRVCRRGSSLERPPAPPPPLPEVPRPPPKTPRRPPTRSFEPPSPSALPEPPEIKRNLFINDCYQKKKPYQPPSTLNKNNTHKQCYCIVQYRGYWVGCDVSRKIFTVRTCGIY